MLALLTLASIAVSAALAIAYARLKRTAQGLKLEMSAARREMDILLQLSRDLEASRSYYAIQMAINTSFRERFGMKNTWIYLAYPEDPYVFDLLTFVGDSEETVRTHTATLSIKGDAMLEQIISSRRAVVVEDAVTDPRTNKVFVEKEKICTLINVPMIMTDRILGVLGGGTFADEGIHRFPPDEVLFAETVASRAAIALDRLRQFNLRGKEQEAKVLLAAAIEQADDGILVAGADGNVMYVNLAFETLLGIEPGGQVGKPLRAGALMDPAPEAFMGIIERARQGIAWGGKLTVRRKSGIRTLKATISPVAPISGEGATSYVLLLRDITADEQLNRAREYFVNITSHEMRTPLTKLMLSGALLHEISSNAAMQLEEMKKCETALNEAYQGLSRISETTSLFTEMTARRPGPAFNTRLESVIQMAIDEARNGALLEGRNVALIPNISLDGGEMADIAEPHFLRVVSEALSNAVKYTPDGKQVTIRAYHKNGSAIIEAIDEGQGLTDHEMETLFTPFFSSEQIYRHTSGRYKFMGGGLGLGLSLMKLIMDHYGGNVTLSRRADAPGMKTRIIVPLSH